MPTSTTTGVRSNRWRPIVALLVSAGCLWALGWHLFLASRLNAAVRDLQSAKAGATGEASVSTNAITNLVSITLTLPPEEKDDNPFAAMGAALGQAMVQSIGPGFIERELNTKARAAYDLYALVVPYRVQISTKPASPEATARMRAAREQAKAEEERVKAAAEAQRLAEVRAFVSKNLALEKVRVATGERFGQPVQGVFGTLVNKGDRALRKVTIRVYFLDDKGRRIGEHDYSPILVTEFEIGDNTPLRPGYRKDFGYSVDDDAPSGWAKRVEVEVVDIDFLAPNK